jgi:hypothetical protein
MKRFYQGMSVTLIIVGFLWMAGCAGSRPEVETRVDRVKGAMSALANALQFYYQDHGYFPKGIATLKDAEYLAIYPDVERQWELKYYTGAGKVTMIEAVNRAAMPDGAGQRIVYRVQENVWEGYGITEFP